MSHDGRAMVWTGSTWVPLLVDAQGRPILDQSLGGGGGASWLPAHTPGLAVTRVIDLGILQAAAPAPAIDITRQAARIAQSPALGVSLLDVLGVAGSEAHTPGLAMGARISDLKMPEVPALEMIQVAYALNRRVGGDVAANVTGTWTGLANAQGIHDGSDATSTGAVSGATRKLSLNYPNHVNKTELTISQVLLHLYVQSAGNTAGLLGSISAHYNIGGGEVLLTGWNARTDTFDFTTTPNTIDITSIIAGSWANLDALAIFVTHVYGAVSTTFVCSVDAVEVEIIASKTDAL